MRAQFLVFFFAQHPERLCAGSPSAGRRNRHAAENGKHSSGIHGILLRRLSLVQIFPLLNHTVSLIQTLGEMCATSRRSIFVVASALFLRLDGDRIVWGLEGTIQP